MERDNARLRQALGMIAIALAAASIGYIGVRAFDVTASPAVVPSASAHDGSREPIPFVDQSHDAVRIGLRAATAEECADIARILEASVDDLRESYRDGAVAARVPDDVIEAELDAFDASVERSRAWIASGCPPHDRLGVVDRGDGSVSHLFLDRMAIGMFAGVED